MIVRRWLVRLVVLAAIAAVLGLWLTRPRQAGPEALAGLTADPARGAAVFAAGGCAACHIAAGETGGELPVLAGGQRFPSPFGTFAAPNISSDPVHGIGAWTALDLLNAMRYGTSPDGQHYYPAFPYASYARAEAQDIVDLHAYLMTLPAAPVPSLPHDLPFPFNIRAGLGGWKLLFLRPGWGVDGELSTDAARGRYLAEALGHCAECHTPRNLLGGLRSDRWLAGAPDPSGKGTIPNITPARLDWSEADIVYYLETGFRPDFDTAGGAMAEVVQNTALLSPEDRAAIAAYLKVVPPVE